MILKLARPRARSVHRERASSLARERRCLKCANGIESKNCMNTRVDTAGYSSGYRTMKASVVFARPNDVGVLFRACSSPRIAISFEYLWRASIPPFLSALDQKSRRRVAVISHVGSLFRDSLLIRSSSTEFAGLIYNQNFESNAFGKP